MIQKAPLETLLTEITYFIDDPDPPLNQPNLAGTVNNVVFHAVFRLLLRNGCILSDLTVVIWAFWTN